MMTVNTTVHSAPRPPLPRCLQANPGEGYRLLQELYNELLNAVAQKFPGETRHQTALRYIREREELTDGQPVNSLKHSATTYAP